MKILRLLALYGTLFGALARADISTINSVFLIVPLSGEAQPDKARELASEGKGLAFLAGSTKTLWTTASNFAPVLGRSIRDSQVHFLLYDQKKKLVLDTRRAGTASLQVLGTYESPGDPRQNYVRLTLPKELSGIALPFATTAPSPGDILKVISEEGNTIRVGQAMGRDEVKQLTESHSVTWEETLFNTDLVYIDYPCDKTLSGGPLLTAQGAFVVVMVKGVHFPSDHKGYCWGVSTRRLQAINQLKPVR